MDRNGLPGVLEETTEESIRETVRWLDGCHFEHVRPIITPRFTPSCTDELMAELGKLARERELYVQSHLSENTREIDWVRELHPDCKQYWETYDKYGLWKDHTVMAHCVHSDQRERAAIRDAGVVVVHCADSNVNICSGLCPVRQMVNEGLWVTLGSDIAGGAGDGFAVGDKLHAVVIDDGDFPEASHPLSVRERFERAIYMTHRHNIVSVWSDGREVVRR